MGAVLKNCKHIKPIILVLCKIYHEIAQTRTQFMALTITEPYDLPPLYVPQVLEYSDRNHTDVADLNKVFSPLLFEKVSPAQSEPLLAYLISTCELIIS